MSGVIVDSCVLLDVFGNDPHWADWSEEQLESYAQQGALYINPIIYTEISIGFERIELLEQVIADAKLQMLPLPNAALFLAGKAFQAYRKNKGTKSSTLPDFFIGAQAAVLKLPLLTRGTARYKTYFPTVELIFPVQ